ncbi:MAG TPA: GTP pyrophosphokinase family protein [Vicinamibacterales bacterium]|nr:GTP pyrophosphokinase family protein [Vicinamibacterales bacterium]HOG28758.1 GTP pyrophosphokinase family protein [Vicinamibacterales bacterium]HPK73008.1 GTP pyrophosphokinase family protein [Vicinamibacterales bacterium]HPW21356.1 GTP pyrophosphokinase family protein [Vicinamibacterales bacterium]
MADIQRSKASYIFDGLTSGVLPEETAALIRSLIATESLYLAATREIATKLEVLNDEFKATKDRNPIQFIQTRVKTPKSIVDKLQRRGLPITLESARRHLTDIAGIRVVCSYIDDIYLIAALLVSQDDIALVRFADYIESPKPNGYRSLHLIVTVPVFLSERTERVAAEIQIRTIAMDFWASLDHELSYKLDEPNRGTTARELRDCADLIAGTDLRMQRLHDIIAGPPQGDPRERWKAEAARAFARAGRSE